MPESVATALQKQSDIHVWDEPELGSKTGTSGRFVDFSNAATNPPMCYLPQVLGIAIAQCMTDDVATLVMFGRWVNLLAGVSLTTLAIARTGALRWFFFMAGLMPMTVFQYASLSPDAVTIGCAWVFLALLIEACVGARRVSQSPGPVRVWPLVVSGAMLGFCKQAYFPLLLGWWLIPVQRLGSWRRAGVGFVVLFMTAGLTFGSWAGVMRATYSPPRLGADPKAQMQFLIEHPERLPTIVLNSAAWGLEHARQFVGVLGMLNIPLPWSLIAWQWFALVLVCLADPASQQRRRGGQVGQSTWNTNQRLLAGWLWVGNWLLLLLALYLTWMNPGDDYAYIQGRYLLPIAPLLAIALAGLWPMRPALRQAVRLWIGPACVVSSLALLLTALTCLAMHYRT